MQIIKLSLNHYNFYCPVTGKAIMDGESMNLNVPSLVAYWEDEDFLNPQINDINLKVHWEDYKSDFDEFEFIDKSLIMNFLDQYFSVDYVAFAIEENAPSVQGWNHLIIFVIHMDYSES
jgi:hypothetical protein